MPDRDRIKDCQGEGGLTEIEQDGACQAFIAECGQDNRVREVHGIDAANRQDISSLCGTRQM